MEKTLCGGQVNFKLEKSSISISFDGVEQGVMCEDCKYQSFCHQLYKMPPAKTILVRAFSGMSIGELPVTHESRSTIEVETRKGEKLKFNKNTGAQINPKNPRFANKIEPKAAQGGK